MAEERATKHLPSRYLLFKHYQIRNCSKRSFLIRFLPKQGYSTGKKTRRDTSKNRARKTIELKTLKTKTCESMKSKNNM